MDEPARRALAAHKAEIDATHLRDLLEDPQRCDALTRRWQGMTVDLARQRVTARTLDLLLAWAEERELPAKIAAMYRGDRINVTEDRPVLHVALRDPDATARPEVRAVRDQIAAFSADIREGRRLGATGKRLVDTVSIGIGGSYLGPEFLHEGLRTDPSGAAAAAGRRLRFLSNVDPIDVGRALEGLDPETTAVVVVSKTFTTAETMLNGRTLRSWLTDRMGASAVSKHMFAVSTNLEAVKAFGIDPANAFGFWDWVGGRYSVTSAVGLAPLAMQYGYGLMREFLAGAHAVDEHFRSAPLRDNLPVLLGLIGAWNATFLGYPSRAFLPYCQALNRLPAHLQQVSMESNGKSVQMDGSPLAVPAGPVEFGEPGTNGQHSFYQLIHQGRVVPCDFVGFRASQHPIHLPGEEVSNHDELMANFFAQPDALALGRPSDDPHRRFSGNRPSSVILMPTCNADALGRLLALLEHRTAVEGFLWGVDSFDQWGVELGKVLAKQVRGQLASARGGGAIAGFNPSTRSLLADYLGET